MARRGFGTGVRIVGMNQVLSNLNREIGGIMFRTRAGMAEAALVIKARSLALTPVDTGNLRASAYTRTVESARGPGAEIGYTAEYAVFVHEMDKNYHVGQWKFLETALKETTGQVIQVIKNRARIRLS